MTRTSDAFAMATSVKDLVARMTEDDEKVLVKVLLNIIARATRKPAAVKLADEMPVHLDVDDVNRVFDCLARLGMVERASEGIVTKNDGEPIWELLMLATKSWGGQEDMQ
jgi:sulfur carrier protein ThiS